MGGTFDGKVVWITGGGSGIGRALALEFARQKANVVVTGRRLERVTAVAAEIDALGQQSLAIVSDVTDADATREVAAQIQARFGRLDVAVANAGFSVGGRFERLEPSDFKRQFDTNVMGVVNTLAAALPGVRTTKGHLAIVSSVAGHIAMPGYSAYTASKYAVRGLGQTLAAELKGSGVSCTTLYPGFVESEIAQVDNHGRFDAGRTDKRPRRLMWSAEDAARVMARAIARRKTEYVFTWHGKIGAFFGRHAPGLVHLLARGK